MKKLCLLIVIASGLVMGSCKKDDDTPTNPNKETNLRYEFTSTTAGNFQIGYRVDTTNTYDSTTNATSWSRALTVTRPSNRTGDSTRFTVIPPEAWIGTPINTLATLKIFVDNVQKVSDTATIGGFDRPAVFSVSTTF